MNQHNKGHGYHSYQDHQWSSYCSQQPRPQQQTPQPVAYPQQGYQEPATQAAYHQVAQLGSNEQQLASTTTTTMQEYEILQPGYRYQYLQFVPAYAPMLPQTHSQTQGLATQYAYQAPTCTQAPVLPTHKPALDYCTMLAQFENMRPPSHPQQSSRAQITAMKPGTCAQLSSPVQHRSTKLQQARISSQYCSDKKTTKVEKYEGEHAGGQARREAEALGPEALQEFELKVERYLEHAKCALGYRWRNGVNGYICEGGTHFMSHAAIDQAMRIFDAAKPKVDNCNMSNIFVGTPADPDEQQSAIQLAVHPPPYPGMQLGNHAEAMQQLAIRSGYVLSGSSKGKGKGYGAPCECVQKLQIPVIDARTGRRIRPRHFRKQGAFQVMWPRTMAERADRNFMF